MSRWFRVRILGWFQYRRPRPFHRLRCWIQRARQGYSDEDVWNLCDYLAMVIGGSVAQLRTNTQGYPGHGKASTHEKWNAILCEIDQAFTEWHLTDGDGYEAKAIMEAWSGSLPKNYEIGDPHQPMSDFGDWNEAHRIFRNRFQHAETLLIRWFGSLWD